MYSGFWRGKGYFRTSKPSSTYCTDSPARIIAVIREKTIVTFSLSQLSAITVRHRIRPVEAMTANKAE